MEIIRFRDLVFTVSEAGIVSLAELYQMGHGGAEEDDESFVAWTHKAGAGPIFCEFDVAGGSSSGSNRLCGTNATAALRYVRHEVTEETLTLVQRSNLAEVTSLFTAYGDTNAIRVTQTVKNVTDEPLCLELANTFGFHFGDLQKENRDWYFHKFTNARYTEALPDVRSLAELGFHWRNQLFQVVNVGNASSYENLPQGILEHRSRGNFLMFEIESYFDWFYQINVRGDRFQFQMGGPTALRHAWNRVLAPEECYTTVPVALAFGKSLNLVIGEMTKYRRHIKAQNESDASLPAIFNEYMHLSWDDPFASRTEALAPAIAKAGCKYYVVDCGWHNSTDYNGRIYHAFGTWREDLGRFPEGIGKTAAYVRSLGMKFGLWLAPEVVGDENTEMLAYYGDECFFQRNGKKIFHGMGYLLDFRKEKVRQYLTETVDRMVTEYGCEYIKFDGCPNAGLGTELDSTAPGEGLERHTEAFLGWVSDMMRKYPHVIFEDCFGGGMRMDYKALSLFSLISTSDQIRYDHYPYITANIFASVLPEQAAVWSYPVDWTVFDGKNTEGVDERVSLERVAVNMVNAVLGRIHLASAIDLLDEEKQALIREGIDFYDQIREDKLRALPYLPLGYAAFGDTHLAAGLLTEEKLYLAVWNLGGEKKMTVPLDGLCVKSARVAYPLSLKTEFTYGPSSLTVEFTEEHQARIFEISL